MQDKLHMKLCAKQSCIKKVETNIICIKNIHVLFYDEEYLSTTLSILIDYCQLPYQKTAKPFDIHTYLSFLAKTRNCL